MAQQVPDPNDMQVDAPVAPPLTTKVAAFGDSLMWGQGLPRDQRFSMRFVELLPIITNRQGARLVWDASRSGAQIKAREQRVIDHRSFDYARLGDREKFIDRFPKYFTNAAEREEFLAVKDDSPARKLYGEVPAPFPTVMGQVKLLSEALGRQIDVVLLDGGVNDLDVEDIVNPQVETGAFVEKWEREIEQVGYSDVLALLRAVRAKCPKAVILYFGFFPTVSEASDTDRIRELFKHEYDSDFAWWFNENVYEAIDVDALIAEAMTRGEWFHNRFLFWTRRAVADANRSDEIRGPGVVFVPSQFGRDQAVFGPSPFLWEDYLPPTTDPALRDRIVGLPRSDALDEMVRLASHTVPITITGDNEDQFQTTPARDLAARLDDHINGPTYLKERLRKYADLPDELSLLQLKDQTTRLWEALGPEITRIQHALIGSMAHPNLDGAKAYSDSAINRYRLHRNAAKALAKAREAGEPPPYDAILRRYNVRGDGPVEADVGMLYVDSLEVKVRTRPQSDASLLPDIWLVLETTGKGSGVKRSREYRLNFRYTHLTIQPRVRPRGRDHGNELRMERRVSKLYAHFEPGKTNVLAVDTLGTLQLDEITGCALAVGPDPYAGDDTVHSYGTNWHPEMIELRVNGRLVSSTAVEDKAYGPGSAVDLNYPAPMGSAVPPLPPTLALKKVPKLDIKKPHPDKLR